MPPWPCPQNPGGGGGRQKGDWERATCHPRPPYLGGGPEAGSAEFLIHSGLNTICEAVVQHLPTFPKTKLISFFWFCFHWPFLVFREHLLGAGGWA